MSFSQGFRRLWVLYLLILIRLIMNTRLIIEDRAVFRISKKSTFTGADAVQKKATA